MSSNRFSVMIESSDFLKAKHETHNKDIHSGSMGDLSRPAEFKLPNTHINREDSISSSKSSFSSLFKKSFEGTWSTGSIIGVYIPRPEKTLALFDTILAALNDLYNKYHSLTTSNNPVETQDCNEICIKLNDRMNLIQNLMADYRFLMDDKQAEFDKICSNLQSLLSNKHSKESIDLADNEAYWLTCKELFVIESKLERCSGRLQFQIMELDFIGKINPLDQYELSIRLNDSTKFKTRIKIEKNGHQVWDCRTFAITPVIDDFLYIKFSEMKPLNKSAVLMEKKLPFINNLIRSDPSIFTLWLSPVGTIKLKVIVQWNLILEDPGLQTYLTGIDCKFSDQSAKNDLSVRSRSVSTSNKYNSSRLSVNIESLFRSDRMNNDSRSNSMGNIAEDLEEDKAQKDISRKVSKDMCFSDNQLSIIPVDKHETKDREDNVIHPLTQDSEKSPSVQVNIIDTDKVVKESQLEVPTIVLLKQESVDIEDDSLNQNINYKVEENNDGGVCPREKYISCDEVNSKGDYTIKEKENNIESNICDREIEKPEIAKEDNLDSGSKDETQEHVSLLQGAPPLHICEDNRQVIESLGNVDSGPKDETQEHVSLLQGAPPSHIYEDNGHVIESLGNMDSGTKDETEEHVSLLQGAPPSHIFEDNGHVIESLGNLYSGSKEETQEHVSLLQVAPPSHIFEDNGQVIESPIITFVCSSSSHVDDRNDDSVKQSDNSLTGDEIGECKLLVSSMEHCMSNAVMPPVPDSEGSSEAPQLLCSSEDLHNVIPASDDSGMNDSNINDTPPVHATPSEGIDIACPQLGNEEFRSDDINEAK